MQTGILWWNGMAVFSIRLLQKPVGNMASKSFPETSVEIASFSSSFNVQIKFYTSLRAESKLITLWSEFVIFFFLQPKQNVRMMLKWHI